MTGEKGWYRVKVGCCGFPWRCHRRFIALELERQGWQVIHIIDSGRINHFLEVSVESDAHKHN